MSLFVVYNADPMYLCINDMTPNVNLPLQILDHGSLTFTPESHPFMFKWKSEKAGGDAEAKVKKWDPELLRQYGEGTLKVTGGKYFLAESAIPGRYVNIYGIGAALTALPVYAAAKFVVPDLSERIRLVWFISRELAAALAALSAVCVFFCALALTERRDALIVAAVFGLGTCVWSTCSQGLWQQTPTVFFLALGACLFVRAGEKPWIAAPCAMAWSMAVLCRPTSAVVVCCAGVHLLLVNRRAFVLYAAAGLPFAVGLAVYNGLYMGSPFAFGQDAASRAVAAATTGSSDIWGTPLSQGLAGLLVSPARGVFVYSPVLLPAIPGMVRIWSDRKCAALRPLCVASVLVLCIDAKFFGWWGGWSYGYRLALDVAVFLSLMLVPMVGSLHRNRVVCGLFAAALLWSVGVQIIGVTAYDLGGWDNRKASVVVRSGGLEPVIVLEQGKVDEMRRDPAFVDAVELTLDVDLPNYRSRLWSIYDSPLVYYATHFRSARESRHALSRVLWVGGVSQMVEGIREWAYGTGADAGVSGAGDRKSPISEQ